MNQNNECERISTSLGRFYRSPNTKLWYPSVTTVVNHGSKEFFKEWSKNPVNKKSSEEACESGNRLHKNAENLILGKDVVYTDPIDIDHYENIKPLRENITDVVAQETILYSDEVRVAGQVDLIAKYNGINSIIDYKTSKKQKKREWINNYFDQAFCYSLMAEELLNIKTPQLVIIMSIPGIGPNVFIERTNSCAAHFLETVRGYWAKNDFLEIQNICEDEYHKK